MNRDRAEGNWKQFKGQVQQKWGKLTNDELDTMEGKREELEGKIQEKYGFARETAKRQVDEFFNAVTPR
ncbi:MAG: CsbD family protein [Candidatus Eremiobacteraeota bacterium]|nr:CsbD family protein [Candidatus Eremiobacteraeota bacterium]